jgi:hypothetical protein
MGLPQEEKTRPRIRRIVRIVRIYADLKKCFDTNLIRVYPHNPPNPRSILLFLWKAHCGRLLVPVLNVAVFFQPLARKLVGRLGHVVYARGVDPPVVKIEEGADRYRVVKLLVREPRPLRPLDVFARYLIRLPVDLLDKLEERFILLREARRAKVFEDRSD